MARAFQWGVGSTIGTGTPSSPSQVTSVMRDAAATVSFLPPASAVTARSPPIPSPRTSPGSAQAPVTTAVGSAGSIASSDGNTHVQIPCTGLTNATAYTFTVHASSLTGAGPESAPSGENTPLSGLVFGDDFNGTAGGPVDPEWWIYDRCGYLAQSEVQYYKPDHCVLDGAGNLKITAEHVSVTGPKYASAGGGSVTQPWTSGACQSNTRLYYPAGGNTMTFEAKFQVNPNAGSGFWPGFFWLEGQTYIQAWKTDPLQEGWDSTGKAEIDVAEFGSTGQSSPSPNTTSFLSNLSTGSGFIPNATRRTAGRSTIPRPCTSSRPRGRGPQPSRPGPSSGTWTPRTHPGPARPGGRWSRR